MTRQTDQRRPGEGGVTDAPAEHAATEAVRTMYESYPFPTRKPTESTFRPTLAKVLCDGVLASQDVAGRSLLDAGCGTGNTVMPLALRCPELRIVGVDMTRAALDVAEECARRHEVKNTSFRQANLLALDLGEEFDFINASGVIHHLADPQRGIVNLVRHARRDGLLLFQLYHPFGEFDRLLGRELVHALWSDKKDLAEGLALVRDLGLNLNFARYGIAAHEHTLDQDNIDADAYLHPLVRTYRFHEIFAAVKAAGATWALIDTVYVQNEIRTINLAEVPTNLVWPELELLRFLKHPSVVARYRQLPAAQKLLALELASRPTGFWLIFGRDGAEEKLSPRARGNLLDLRSLEPAGSR